MWTCYGNNFLLDWELLQACKEGDITQVRAHLHRGADVNSADNDGYTALHWTSFHGHYDIVRLLLDLGADIHRRDKHRETSLHVASYQGHLAIVRLLLHRGADVHHQNYGGDTPLHKASYDGHLDIIRLLLNRGADMNLKNKQGLTPLIVKGLTHSDNHCEDVEGDSTKQSSDAFEMEPIGTLRNPTIPEVSMELCHACQNGDIHLVQDLIQRNADIHLPNDRGWTPLLWASYHGHLDVVQLLINHNADIDHQDENGNTALFWASYHGHSEVVQLLLDHGADIHHPNNHGSTVLSSTSSMGHLDIVRLLLDHGADIHYQDKNGWTALQVASDNNHLAVVQLLLNRGADMDDQNDDGDTALDRTSWFGHLEIVRLLVERGADIHRHDKYGWTALHRASHHGHVDVVRLLLERGADRTRMNKMGQTPYDLATQHGSCETASLLLSWNESEPTPSDHDRMNGRQLHSSNPVDDSKNSSQLSCQICNMTFDDRISKKFRTGTLSPWPSHHHNVSFGKRIPIECVNGHVVDSQCLCYRNCSTIITCPICDADIDLHSLISKIPIGYLLEMLWKSNCDLINVQMMINGRMDMLEESHTQMTIDHEKVMEVVNSKLELMWKQLTIIATEANPCPRHILMVPTVGVQKKTWRDWLSEPLTVYFVCERTHALVKAFETRQPREWVQKVAPAMSVSLRILAKIGFSAIDPTGTIAAAATDFIEYIFDESLQGFDEKVSHIAFTKMNDILLTKRVVDEHVSMGAKVIEILEGSYRALAEEAAKHPEWKTKMTSGISEITGKLEWYRLMH